MLISNKKEYRVENFGILMSSNVPNIETLGPVGEKQT